MDDAAAPPLVHKRTPAKQLVNVVMQLPADVPLSPDPNVRLARDSDIPLLNRWRRLYKEERGILFDADMDAWVQHQRVFVYETLVDATAVQAERGTSSTPAEGLTAVVAVAKIDLDLQTLVENGGVFTFPGVSEPRLWCRHCSRSGVPQPPTGQDPYTSRWTKLNGNALRLYEAAGWRQMGKLARVWLTG